MSVHKILIKTLVKHLILLHVGLLLLIACAPNSQSLNLLKSHKYQIMKSAHGYKANGVASWYGKKFNRQHTSDGKRYNMYSLTAAHRTLPLNSSVKVTNLENGKTVVVRINDRGPFRYNRLIDLSYAAALKLGMLPRGTVKVAIVAVNTA